MNTMVLYLLQTVACGGVFYLLYRTVIDGRAGFRFCRAYLLGSMALAAVIPALDIPLYPAETAQAVPAVLPMPEITATPWENPGTPFPWENWAWGVYGVVGAALLGTTTAGLLRIRRLYRTGVRIAERGYTLVQHPRVKSPFSFYRNIFVGPHLAGAKLSLVAAHELSHIRHNHSTERVAAEIIKAVLWFNPFAWMMQLSLVQVHEYEADSDVIDGGCDMVRYRDLILEQLFGCTPDAASGLSRSLTKKRFMMMTQNTKRGRFLGGFAATLLAVTGLMLSFSFTKQQPGDAAGTPPQGEKTGHILYFLDGKEITDAGDQEIRPYEIESIDILKNESAIAQYGERAKAGVVKITSKRAALEAMDDPRLAAEDMPRFEGGDALAFQRWSMQQIRYPQEAIEKKIEGTVVVSFLVDKAGYVSLACVTNNDVPPVLAREALRVVNSSPRWTPGKQEGQAVGVKFTFPIRFALPAS